MDEFIARILAVNTVPLGGNIAVDTPEGSTTIELYDLADINPDGGWLRVLGGEEEDFGGGEETLADILVEYSAADDETGLVSLVEPLPVGFSVDDRVEVWDLLVGGAVVETVAQVVLEGEEENADPVEATVDHALVPYLPDGIRDVGGSEAVTLAYRGSELFVVNVVGRSPVMDGDFIDPDTIPGGGEIEPSEPPTVGAPTVLGGVNSIIVKWSAVVHPNPVKYRVYVSDVSPVDVDAESYVGELSGTMLTVRQLPKEDPETEEPTTPLRYDTVYYAAVQAVDTFDEAEEFLADLSPEAEGSPVQINSPDIAADAVHAEHITAGSITGESFAGELILGSRITTAELGQRVEMDANGFRLYNSEDELRVNLPTAEGEDPAFRGVVEADGLTVRQGASFYSTLNEFAKDSVISLAEQVAAPIAAPGISSFYPWQAFQQEAQTGSLGTFPLDPSQVIHVSWNAAVGVWHFVQRVSSGGARVWYYYPNGAYNTLWDLPSSWRVTSVARGSDGQFRIMYRWDNKWWIYDYALTNPAREYTVHNTARDPILTMDGTNVWVAETVSNAPRFYRVNTSTPIGGTTVVETVTTSGGPAGSGQPTVFYRGSADFGGARFVVSYAGTLSYRVYNSSGAYQADQVWSTPVAKAGATWDPVNNSFVTFGQDGRLYRHTSMTWTDPALDTWHLAQTFYDGQVAGGTHETVIGAVRTFNPVKRSYVRVTPVTVPYAGGEDDPNQWRIYGKTGTAPGSGGSGLTLQQSGNYVQPIRDIGALLSASGTAPPTFSNFPNATPARMISGRSLPSDGTKPIFEVRGDGSGRWGGLEVDGAGNVTLPGDIDPIVLPLAATRSGTLTVARRSGLIVYEGLVTGGTWSTSAANQIVANGDIPDWARPGVVNAFICAHDVAASGSFHRVFINSATSGMSSRTGSAGGVHIALNFVAQT